MQEGAEKGTERITLATYRNPDTQVEETCLLVEGVDIQASMRNLSYPVKVCFTKNSLLANDCKCGCGCHYDVANMLDSGDDRIACTHSISLLVMLSALVFEALGEHILVKLNDEGRVFCVLRGLCWQEGR